MKRSTTIIALAAAGAITVFSITGCSDGKKIKEQALEALHKQAEIQSYTFEGQTELQLGDTLTFSNTNPLTAALVQSLTSAKLDWTGTANANPPRLESTLKITPKGGAALPDVPILIKDNKLYTQIPLLNPKNEFLSLDMSKAAAGLTNSSQTFAKMAETLLQGIDAKWFKTDPVENAAPASPVWDVVTIGENNVKPLSAILQNKLAEWVDMMQSEGVVTKTQAESIKKALSKKTVKLQQPGSIRIAVGADGFVQELQADIRFVLEENSTASPIQSLKLSNKWGQINQSPAFTREIPAQSKPFDDILKSLNK
jgi:hypothetical protein